MPEEPESILISGRRVVSVVFCDICNFTSISERLDAEEVFELINNIFEILTSEVENCGGYVDKYIGDCVMAIFGAGRSDGAHAEEAVSAALAMQERLTNITHPICRNRGIKLQIRIGINSGLVYAGYVGGKDNKQFTVMGDTVNLSQRMEQMAKPGSILVAAATARQVVHDFVLEEVGNLEVKGKSKEVRAFRILRPRENRIEDHNLNF
jgi:class 3 adenylate cyclase